MESQIAIDASWCDRTSRLLGGEAVTVLGRSRVLVVGVGGVGGYAVEMLARSGIGHLTLVDADNVAMSNLNRQLIALRTTLGRPKTELFAERCRDINPEIEVDARQEFLTVDNVESLLDSAPFDYVIDCIDTVAPKVALLTACRRRHLRVISSMGAGGRVDPTKVGYMRLDETREDGLARAVRQRLKKMGVRPDIKVVASVEAPRISSLIEENGKRNKQTSYGTLAAVPAVFGILLANHVILKLADYDKAR